MKTYIKHTSDKRSKNYCLFEVTEVEKIKGFGRDMVVVRPVKGLGHIKVNAESVIVK
jgi:hypothetical protein